MFYEESYVRSLIKCNQCEKVFTDYDQPKSLPCGETICSDCESKIQKEAINKRFRCVLCNEEHYLLEKGFPLNKIVLSLISAQPKRVSRGKQYERLRINIQSIEKLMNDLKSNGENGVDIIKIRCSEQKRVIQLSIEKKIEELHELNEKLQEKMDDFEKEYIENFLENVDSIVERNNLRISEAKDFLDNNIEYLKEYQVDDDNIENTNKMAENLILKLERENGFNIAAIFNDKKIKFELNLEKIYDSLIGSFEYDLTGSYHTEIFCQSKDDTSIILIDLNSSTAIKKFEGHTQRITFLKQTPCRKLISGSYDGLIKIWDIDTGECLKSIDEQSGEVIYIYIVSIDSFVASFFENNNLILFDLNSGNVIGTFVGHVSIINVIEKISNDKIVTCSNDRTLRIWSLRKSGVCLKILKGHTGIVFCLRVISNEKIISGSDDQTIKIWEIESGNCLKTLEGHTDEVYEIIQLSDEKIASSSKNGQIKIWKIKEAECIETIETGELITCLYNFSEDMILYSSQQVIAGSYSRNNILKLFNIKTKMCWRTIDIGSVFIEIKEN